MNDANTNIIEGRKPEYDEKFYLDWGRESLKNNLTLANDILKQELATNTALLGIFIAFLDKQTLLPIYKLSSCVLFLIGIVISFLGLLPYEKMLYIDDPDGIRSHKKKALTHKRRYIWVSAIITFLGLITALFGIPFS